MRRVAFAASVVSALVVGGVVAAGAYGATGPGSELDSATFSSNVSIPSSCSSSTSACTVVAGSPVTYDGSTKVRVGFSDYGANSGSSGATMLLAVYEDGAYVSAIFDVSSSNNVGVSGWYEVIPTAGSHTFSIRAWMAGSATGTVFGQGQMSVTQVNGTWSGGGSSTLAGLSDVAVSSPSAGDVLTYDGGTSKWTNKPDTDASTAAAASCGTSTTPSCMVDVSESGVAAGFANNLHDDLFVLVGAIIGAALIPMIARWFLGSRG